MCAKSDGIYPPPDRRGKATRLRKSLPAPDEICQSAVVALLFLFKSFLPMSVPDMYYLMASSLGHTDSEYSQLLPGIPEGKSLRAPLSRLRLNFPK
jgi:hypothetical protein